MSVTAARGFVASGVAAGIKPSGDLDLALVATEDHAPVPAAAVFTANKMTAAPVVTSARHLALSTGLVSAVVLNSGNANAATGSAGLADAEHTCDEVATALGCASEHVLVCSTGLIGIPLPIDALLGAVPAAAAGLRNDGGATAAEAIMTTDTRRKEATAEVGGAVVGGMAKGAAMLAPDMATMLAVLTTDALIEPHELQQLLRSAVASSFNRLVVDGCQSTNDTVIILASGRAGPVAAMADLEAAIGQVCADLAMEMAGDAEGATKVVRLTVSGARSDEEADRGARQIAGSALCKCSWYGQDPYWGRLASELGTAGIDFDPTSVSVAYGGVVVARGGVSVAHDDQALAEHMTGRYLDIRADLGLGPGEAAVVTNDLTHAYIDENMRTS